MYSGSLTCNTIILSNQVPQIDKKYLLTKRELNMETRISSRMGISWNIAEKFDVLS